MVGPVVRRARPESDKCGRHRLIPHQKNIAISGPDSSVAPYSSHDGDGSELALALFSSPLGSFSPSWLPSASLFTLFVS